MTILGHPQRRGVIKGAGKGKSAVGIGRGRLTHLHTGHDLYSRARDGSVPAVGDKPLDAHDRRVRRRRDL